MQPFIALADPVRARIVEMLAREDLSAGDIATAFAISRPAISRHLSVLLRSRLVSVRGEAQRRIYSLDPAGFDRADAWIDAVRDAWNQRLGRLGRRLNDLAENAAEKTAETSIVEEGEVDEPWRPLPRRTPL